MTGTFYLRTARILHRYLCLCAVLLLLPFQVTAATALIENSTTDFEGIIELGKQNADDWMGRLDVDRSDRSILKLDLPRPDNGASPGAQSMFFDESGDVIFNLPPPE
ncbi:MAG: hypothetical protein ACI9IV_000317 [Paracoccaceae bacterium]|jgi:hypothetical protein